MSSGQPAPAQHALVHSRLDAASPPSERDLEVVEIQEKQLKSRSGANQSSSPANHSSHSTSSKSLERVATVHDDAPQNVQIAPTATNASGAGPVYSVFTKNQKRFIVLMAAWAGFFSPVSGNIYFPALNPLAKHLNVSNTLINLTLTSYMVCMMDPKQYRSHDRLTTTPTDFSRPCAKFRWRLY